MSLQRFKRLLWMQNSRSTIEELLQRYTDQWLQLPGVIGTGEGQVIGKPCILVFVKKSTEELSKQIPKRVEGFPVVIQEIGEVKAL